MNWRVSFLDRFRLVSNSDAHSPGKLGREATAFDCELDYFAIRRALKTGEGFAGTVEFFPEEGKYHLDGHRKCNVRLTPRETLGLGGRCPACGQPVTIGVEHRVEALADRHDAVTPPATAGAVASLVPLPEVLSEIAASGPASKAVERSYDKVIATLGPELFVLQEAPLEDVARAASPLLAEALTRLRKGEVIREAGYDGEYGVIRLFEERELKRLTAGDVLFDAPVARKKKIAPEAKAAACARTGAPPLRRGADARARAGGIRPARRARPGPARGRRDRRRAAGDHRGSGLGQDAHADAPHRASRRRARRAGRAVPRHHVHAPRRRRAARAARRPARRDGRATSRSTPSTRSASPSCASIRPRPGCIAASTSPTSRSASGSWPRGSTSRRRRPRRCCARSPRPSAAARRRAARSRTRWRRIARRCSCATRSTSTT